MKETLVTIEVSNLKNKKYKATVKNKSTGKTRTIQFGQRGAGQYKDSTSVGNYSSYNFKGQPGGNERRKRYFQRHSGKATKREALKLEKEKSKGLFTPKIMSHQYLW